MTRRNISTANLAAAYIRAREIIETAGYSEEINWQSKIRLEDLTEQIFLCESAWVILSTGMKEQIIRSKFKAISECFFDFQSAEIISQNEKRCRNRAIKHFKHPRKLNAITQIAKIVTQTGFTYIHNQIKADPIVTLSQLPFIGPVTSYHLAKNIGVPVAKPDRHLVRLAAIAGYGDVQTFCETISAAIGDPVQVVDVVLWRYANLTNDYQQSFLPYS